MKYIKRIDEAFIGPFVFNDKMSDEELKAMYDGALDGYANHSKGFQHAKSKYKEAYQAIEKILKKRGVSVDEAEEVNEAKFVKSYDTKVNDAETEKEVKKIYPKYKKIGVGKLTHFFGELEPNLFFKAYYPKYYKQDTGKSIKGDFKITSVYSFRNGNGVELMKESVEVTEAIDVNDPVLVAFRATRRELPKLKLPKVKSRRLSFDKYMDLLDDQRFIDQEIKDMAEEMAQTLRDMEQEAEPEGGEIADRYGSIMMKQEKEYAKLKAKKAKIDARIEKHRMS